MLWVVYLIGAALYGVDTAHQLVIGSIWTHVDVWAPAANTALLIYLAHVQIRDVKHRKEVKQVGEEATKALLEVAKEHQQERVTGE